MNTYQSSSHIIFTSLLLQSKFVLEGEAIVILVAS